MIPPLDRQSETYSPMGNLASAGLRNQLGRPRLDSLAVLVRESVQNCWDARIPELARVGVRFDVTHATRDVLVALREVVFMDVPANMPIGERLDRTLADEGAPPLHVVAISDRGTSGLGGPTRADTVPSQDDGPGDFVDFLRNIGQPPDKDLGGGTFGYGKAALYGISAWHTMCVYTRCRYKGRSERRFFVAGLSAGYTVSDGRDRGRYTGRHWWGRRNNDLVDPLLDDDADALARALGLPTFREDEYGTTIALLDADFGLERTAEQAVRIIVDALLWNFWPKIVALEAGRPGMTFGVTLDGQEVPIPRPAEFAPLGGFQQAMDLLKARREGKEPTEFGHFQEVWSRKPQMLLGWLALARLACEPRSAFPGDAPTGGIRTPTAHHVALMRDAELVVKYLEGPALQTDRFEYAGVFVASRDADRAFARSEPPTHDDWVPHALDDRRHRTFVNVGLRTIADAMQKFAQPTAESRVAGEVVPLAHLANSLGALLTGLPGEGGHKPRIDAPRVRRPIQVEESNDEAVTAEPSATRPSSSPAPLAPSSNGLGATASKPPVVGRARVRMEDGARLDIVDGQPVFVVPFSVVAGKRSTGTRVVIHVAAEVDGDRFEDEPPDGAATPSVFCWEDPGGRRSGMDSPAIDIPAAVAGRWFVYLRVVDDAALRVSIDGKALESS